MGFFWKRAEMKGALAAAAGTFVFSLVLMLFFPEISFIDRMAYVFILCVLLIVVFGLLSGKKTDERAIILEPGLFATTWTFKLLSGVILAILGVIYYVFW